MYFIWALTIAVQQFMEIQLILEKRINVFQDMKHAMIYEQEWISSMHDVSM